MKHTFIKTASKPQRLDRFLSEKLSDLSRSQIIKNCSFLEVNQKPAKPSLTLKAGDEVIYGAKTPVPPEEYAIPSPRIIYEDKHLLIINKRAGELVHPGSSVKSGTLSDYIKTRVISPNIFEDPARPGVVHRLDKMTAGLLMMALTPDAEKKLKSLFKKRLITKKYMALVHGTMMQGFRVIDLPIGKHPQDFRKRAVYPKSNNSKNTGKRPISDSSPVKNPKDALTEVTVHTRYDHYSLLEVQIKTGRTHQIRVHLAHSGYPVCGDPLYGRKDKFTHLQLMACRLAFKHPASGRTLDFKLCANDFCDILPDFPAVSF